MLKELRHLLSISTGRQPIDVYLLLYHLVTNTQLYVFPKFVKTRKIPSVFCK